MFDLRIRIGKIVNFILFLFLRLIVICEHVDLSGDCFCIHHIKLLEISLEFDIRIHVIDPD